MWFYTTNPQYFSPPVPKPQSEQPIGSFEGHLSYDVKPRLWFSLDGNFWFGGITSLSGIPNPVTHQTSSRIGATASIPLGPHQSVRSVTTTALHPIWRKLLECCRRVAVLLARQACLVKEVIIVGPHLASCVSVNFSTWREQRQHSSCGCHLTQSRH